MVPLPPWKKKPRRRQEAKDAGIGFRARITQVRRQGSILFDDLFAIDCEVAFPFTDPP
jgi:hypothetical protein